MWPLRLLVVSKGWGPCILVVFENTGNLCALGRKKAHLRAKRWVCKAWNKERLGKEGMESVQNKKNVAKLAEAIFDAVYLLLVWGLGFYYLATGESTTRLLWAGMCLVLAVGDSCHLIPRILVALKGDETRFKTALGRGKQIASITMSLLYILLWQAGLTAMNARSDVTFLMIGMAAVRVVLCLLPQNKWCDEKPSQLFSILRNIPFLVQGVLVMWFFSNEPLRSMQGLENVWLAVMISFECYLVVVLFAQKKPALGMLMIPKSVAYLWLLFMGLALV